MGNIEVAGPTMVAEIDDFMNRVRDHYETLDADKRVVLAGIEGIDNQEMRTATETLMAEALAIEAGDSADSIAWFTIDDLMDRQKNHSFWKTNHKLGNAGHKNAVLVVEIPSSLIDMREIGGGWNFDRTWNSQLDEFLGVVIPMIIHGRCSIILSGPGDHLGSVVDQQSEAKEMISEFRISLAE